MREEAVVALRLDTTGLPAASKQAETSLAKIGETGKISAGQTAAAMRQLPAQLTDVATQLAGGQNPLLVLLQQGGQVKDSFGGIGPAARGIGSAIASIRPAVLGIGVLASGAAALAYGFISGHNESEELKKSLNSTGNQAVQTLGQIDSLSRGMAASGRVTIGTAREITAGLVGLGTLGGPALEAATRAGEGLAKATGRSAEEIVKSLALAGEAPTAFAQKANQAYRFLTSAQFEQIRSLEAQGRTQEAAKLSLNLLADTMQQRSVPAMGYYESAINGVSRAWSSFVDGLKSVGRDRTTDDDLEFLNRRITELERLERTLARVQKRPEDRRGALAAAEAERDALQDRRGRDLIRGTERSIAQSAENQKIEEASAQHQAALAGTEKAGAQLRLAQLQASISRERDLNERRFAEDLASAAEYQAERLRLDLAGVDAEIRNLDRLRAAEAARKPGTPQERLAQESALVQLEAQRVALAEKRAKIERDEAAGLRDVAPKARELPGDALRRINKQLDDQAEKDDRAAADRRLANDKQFLQELQDQNARASVELIEDERARGEAIVALDYSIALRRIKLADLSAEGRAKAEAEAGKKYQLDREKLDQDLNRNVREDLRGSISAALRDSSGNPAKAFASALANAVSNRLADSIADTLSRQILSGGGGFGGLAGFFEGLGFGANGNIPSGYSGNLSGPVDGFAGAFAAGGFIPPGKWGWTGEEGPEPVYGGRTGATVVSARQSRSMTFSPTIQVHIDARADAAQVASQTRQAIDQALQQYTEQLRAQGRL